MVMYNGQLHNGMCTLNTCTTEFSKRIFVQLDTCTTGHLCNRHLTNGWLYNQIAEKWTLVQPDIYDHLSNDGTFVQWRIQEKSVVLQDILQVLGCTNVHFSTVHIQMSGCTTLHVAIVQLASWQQSVVHVCSSVSPKSVYMWTDVNKHSWLTEVMGCQVNSFTIEWISVCLWSIVLAVLTIW